jgi:predicted RNase H-like nuclease
VRSGAAVLATATALLGLVTIAERPAARLRDVAGVCAYLAVRRWYLTAASLLVVGLLAQLYVVRPAIALGLAAAPLLSMAPR